jgi:hypothetical protein
MNIMQTVNARNKIQRLSSCKQNDEKANEVDINKYSTVNQNKGENWKMLTGRFSAGAQTM